MTMWPYVTLRSWVCLGFLEGLVRIFSSCLPHLFYFRLAPNFQMILQILCSICLLILDRAEGSGIFVLVHLCSDGWRGHKMFRCCGHLLCCVERWVSVVWSSQVSFSESSLTPIVSVLRASRVINFGVRKLVIAFLGWQGSAAVVVGLSCSSIDFLFGMGLYVCLDLGFCEN